jgi:hypothetical protein
MLTGFYGINSLYTIEGDLIIENNSSLENLIGLNSLEYIASDFKLIDPEGSVTSLSGIDLLDSIGGCMYLNGLLNLNNLSSTNSLKIINGTLEISIWNENLTSLGGFSSLHTIGNDLILWIPYIQSLSGLDSLESIGSDLVIGSFDLISLANLGSLSSLGGSLKIYTEKLTDLQGLEKLHSIGTDLNIEKNDALINLKGLDSLKYISGSIYIYDNPLLNSLTGLDFINSDSIDYILIMDNPNLKTCNVESICSFISSSSSVTSISGNHQGCNSETEIEIECETVSVADPLSSHIIIYPNPAENFVTINMPEGKHADMVNIYDQAGRLVRQIKPYNPQIDISDIESGVYILEIIQKNTRSKKLLSIL